MFCVLNSEYIFKFSLQFIINLSLNPSCRTERELVNKIVEDMYNKVQPNENNTGDLEATREAKNKAHVTSGVYVSGGKISGSNVNFGEQGDVVSGVTGDFIKDVKGNVIKG